MLTVGVGSKNPLCSNSDLLNLNTFNFIYFSGVDIPSVLQAMSISESIIDKLKDSTMGHYAIAYMCYKVMTPVRYMVTVGMVFIRTHVIHNQYQ